MRRTCGVLLAAALGLGTGASAASAAGLDTVDTFGVGGVAITPLAPAAQDRFLGVTPGPGGGTYAVGFVNAGGTDTAMALARVDTNGDLDPTFDGDGVATLNVVSGPFALPPAVPAPTGAAETARGVGVQSDGKIVIAGQAETATSPAPSDSRDLDVYVARFNADGTLDTTFGVAGTRRINLSNGDSTDSTIVTDQAWGLNILSDDKIVVTGARGADIVARPDRTVIVGSTAPSAVAGAAQLNALLVMLEPNGTLDASFGNNGAISVHLGGPSDALFGSTILPGAQKVVAAGYRGASPNTGDEAALIRIDLSKDAKS